MQTLTLVSEEKFFITDSISCIIIFSNYMKGVPTLSPENMNVINDLIDESKKDFSINKELDKLNVWTYSEKEFYSKDDLMYIFEQIKIHDTHYPKYFELEEIKFGTTIKIKSKL